MSRLPYGQNERGQSFNMNGHAPSNGLVQDQDLFYGSIFSQLTQPANFQLLGKNGQGSAATSQGTGQDLFQELLGGLNRGLINDAPWNPLRATTSSRTAGYKPRQSGPIDYQSFGDYRNPAAASDCEDSGYHSMKHSVIDASVYGDQDRGTETQSLFGFEGLQLQTQHHASPDSISVDGRHSQTRWPPRSVVNPDSKALWCETCKCHVKTKAELNKHKQRHEKPYICDIKGCTRKEGFGTTNDLARHQQSVHGMAGPKFRCPEEKCKTKSKDWPRADNFKQHLKRMHHIHLPADFDLSVYEYKKRPDDPVGPSSSEAPVDMLPHPEQVPQWSGFPTQESANPPSGEIEYPQTDQGMDMSDGQDTVDEAAEESSEEDDEAENAVEQPVNHDLRLDMDPVLLNLGHQHINLDQNGTAAPSDIYQDSPFHRPDHLSPSDLMMPPARSEMLQTIELSRLDMSRFRNQKDHMPEGSHRDTARGSDQHTVSKESQGDISEDSALSTSEDVMDDANIKRPEPESASHEISASRVKELLRSKSLDETEASALFASLMEKGMLDKLVEKFGYRKAKDDEEEEKESPPSPAAQSSEDAKETKEGSVKDGGKYSICKECGKDFRRKCELKKHMKRHQKPYACTHVPDCDKRFGSKNDWKRHENSQHIQLEYWRCTERVKDKDRPNVNVLCNKICHRRETFRHHLDKDHAIRDAATVEKRCNECRNGRNFDARFWCGFCQKTIEFEKNGGLAWSERFDHIDAHFTGKGGPKRDISEWKSIENAPLETFETIVPDAHLSIASSASDISSYEGSGGDDEFSGLLSRKRRAADDAAVAASKRMRTHDKGFKQIDYRSVLWVCCSCEGLWSHANTTTCMDQDCRHEFCTRCGFVLPAKEEDEVE